ncbi:hypothetical protein VTK73DRAFT_7993 [Phialemonium thermophilum]|uniref:TauD/TfdA-like domain-containing protein n=1 Tax=Phialemonium thermophilum TaxID=223376 RepID=A0ABR3WB29_9PEZI
MPHVTEPLRVNPLAQEVRKGSMVGAEVTLPTGMQLLDLDVLSEQDKQTLRDGVFNNGVVVIRNQQGLDPTVMQDLGKFFDSTSLNIHSGGEKSVTDSKNILAANKAVRVPRAPQVTIIGNGKWTGHEGLPDFELRHVSHTEFHEDPLSQEELGEGYTRPYRWHMDAPAYERLPGFVTSLLSLKTPRQPDQKLKFPDGRTVLIPTGATAFISGARAFQLLSDEEKEFALNTTVQYAPRAYEWMLDCKATDDGLTIAKKGREKSLDELPEWTWDKVQTFPMIWKNYGNGEPHLQILGCCVYELRTTNPVTGEVTVESDLDKVRQTCRELMGKAYTPETIYFHRWQEGDLVIFHNRGVLHSITGELDQLGTDGADAVKRLLWQCNMASTTPPVAYTKL